MANSACGFNKGQTVYLKTRVHLLKCWEKEKIIEGKIISIGPRYITVRIHVWEDVKFDITDDLREKTDTSPHYELYATKQEIYDYWQSCKLRLAIRRLFEHGDTINLENLQKIASVLGITIDEEQGETHA